MSPLYDEVMKKRKAIYTDGYSMSIAGLLRMYLDKDLDLHPEFQRRLRWSRWQKTRLIESILIGVPIPSILVYKREDEKWDLIDGLQRLSTIFQFMGHLESGDGRVEESFPLVGTSYLPALEGKRWKSEQGEDNGSHDVFSERLRRLFNEQKLDVLFVEEEHNEDARYDLFDRINTGGSPLSVQELRNFLLLMMGKHEFHRFIRELAEDPAFTTCIKRLEKSRFAQQGDLELVVRFLVLRHSGEQELVHVRHLPEFLTQKIRSLSQEDTFDMESEQDIFRETFALLVADETLKEDCFTRFDIKSRQFEKSFSITAYQAIVVGLSHHCDEWQGDTPEQSSEYAAQLAAKIKSLWTHQRFIELCDQLDNANETDDLRIDGQFVKIGKKLTEVITLGKEWFRHES